MINMKKVKRLFVSSCDVIDYWTQVLLFHLNEKFMQKKIFNSNDTYNIAKFALKNK